MIRYYAYYSCGGYKDMYLGNSAIASEYTYFLPLLPIWEKGAKPEYAAKVELANSLNLIEIVTQSQTFGFPSEAKVLFSHGGYRMIYRTLDNGNTCFAVRDITNETKDEEDREIPFTILIIASNSDITKLDAFAIQSLDNPQEAYQKLSALFAYDQKINGISFAIQKLNNDIENALRLSHGIKHDPGKVVFMLIDSFSMKDKALKELSLTSRQVEYIADITGKNQGELIYNLIGSVVTDPEIESFNEPDDDINQPAVEDLPIEKEEEPKVEKNEETKFGKEFTAIKSELDSIHKTVKSTTRALTDKAAEMSRKLDELDRKASQQERQTGAEDQSQLANNAKTDKIIIDNPSLFFSLISLIVGFLLGALIF